MTSIRSARMDAPGGLAPRARAGRRYLVRCQIQPCTADVPDGVPHAGVGRRAEELRRRIAATRRPGLPGRPGAVDSPWEGATGCARPPILAA